MTHLSIAPLPLTGRRLSIFEDRPPGRRVFTAALRRAGGIVTALQDVAAAGQAAAGCRPSDAVVLVPLRTTRHDMTALGALRESGFRGLMLVVLEDWSPDSAMRWVRLGGVDDCVPKPADPSDFPCQVADYFIRSRNAMPTVVSAFAPAGEAKLSYEEAGFTAGSRR